MQEEEEEEEDILYMRSPDGKRVLSGATLPRFIDLLTTTTGYLFFSLLLFILLSYFIFILKFF